MSNRRAIPAIVGLVSCVVLMAASAATAHAGPFVGDTDREQARRLVKLGDERFAEGEFERARQAYRGAHLIMGVPTTGLQLARAEVAVGQLVQAQSTLRALMRSPVEEDEPAAFERARAQARQLDRDLQTRIPSLSIRLMGESGPGERWVTVDGKRIPPQELGKPRGMNPGSYEVATWIAGQPKTLRTVRLREGAREVLQLDATPPAPVVSGMVLSPLVWTGFALAGAGTVVGAITGGVSLALAADVKDVCFEGRICPRSAEAKRDDSLRLAHASTVSFAVAGLGSLLGIVGFVISEPTATSRATVQTWLEVGPAGTAWGVRF